MKRGMIMELRGGLAVLLDGSGDMVTVSARPEWRVGDTVDFPRRRAPMGRWGAMAAALLLVLGAGVFGTLYFAPYSLMSLDVNPSVELTLNRFDRVISMRAMNDEGEELLSLSGVKNKTAGEALDALLGGDYLAGYLGGDAVVTMTVQSDSLDRERTLLNLLDTTAEEELCANYENIRVDCVGVDSDTVTQAHGHGVTAGKYLALMELKAADPTVDISQYTHCGIGEIRSEIDRCHQNAGDTETGESEGEGCGYGYGYGYGGGNGSGNGRHHHGGR